MRKIIAFNSISIDGFFTDNTSDVSWAHSEEQDAEFNAFVADNASGGGALLLGRVTYDLMASFWPTPQAKQMMPEVAKGMNGMEKLVFSRTVDKLPWENSKLIKGDLIEKVREIKSSPGKDIAILGSGSIVSQLTQARLIDEYQVMVIPIILGKGRTQFEGLNERMPLKLIKSRIFKNGNVYLSYTLK